MSPGSGLMVMNMKMKKQVGVVIVLAEDCLR